LELNPTRGPRKPLQYNTLSSSLFTPAGLTSAFGGQRSFFEPNVGRSFRNSDSANANPGIADRRFPCSIAAKTTMALVLF
jgi:hypothetical protein